MSSETSTFWHVLILNTRSLHSYGVGSFKNGKRTARHWKRHEFCSEILRIWSKRMRKGQSIRLQSGAEGAITTTFRKSTRGKGFSRGLWQLPLNITEALDERNQQTAADECAVLSLVLQTFVILKVSRSLSEPSGKKNLSLYIGKYFGYGQKLINLHAGVLNTQ